MIAVASIASPIRPDVAGGATSQVGRASGFAEVIAACGAPDTAPPTAPSAVAPPAATVTEPGVLPPAAQAEALIAQFVGQGSRPAAPACNAGDPAVAPASADAEDATPEDGVALDAAASSGPIDGAAAVAATPAPPASVPLAAVMPAALPVVALVAAPPQGASPALAGQARTDAGIVPARPRMSAALSGQAADRMADTSDDPPAQAPAAAAAGNVFALAAAADGTPLKPADGPTVAWASPPPADVAITHHLDLAQDHVWLDQLAQDISRSADPNGRLRFALAPQHLGRMTVDLAAGVDGTAIRLTTESEQARRIVSDAQPRLIAEAQAQGLRITETQVALDQRPSGQHRHEPTFADAGGAGGGRSRGDERPQQTFAEAQSRPAAKRPTAATVPAARHLYA